MCHYWQEEDLLPTDSFFSCGFLSRFEVSQRASVSGHFRKWARTSNFKDPAALVGKVRGTVCWWWWWWLRFAVVVVVGVGVVLKCRWV